MMNASNQRVQALRPDAAGNRAIQPAPARRRRLRFRPKPGLFFIVPVFILTSSLIPLGSMISLRLQLAREIRELNKEIGRLEGINEKLDREVAWRQSLDYVEQEARKNGMVSPGEIQYQFSVPTDRNFQPPVKRDNPSEIGD